MKKVYYNDIDSYCCAVLKKNIERGNLPPGDVDERDIKQVRADELARYQHIHLFAGIGGFPLGIGSQLDKYRIVTGGFPCQPHSLAGKRKASEDERDFWPETFRVIRHVKPDYVLGENVMGLLSSEHGHFFGGILRDLASIGYDAWWIVLRASDVGAPHQRARVFLVAYPINARCTDAWNISATQIPGREESRRQQSANWTGRSSQGDVAYSTSARSESTRQECTGRSKFERSSKLADTNIQRCEKCDVTASIGDVGLDTRSVETLRVSGQTQPRLGGMSTRLSGGMDSPYRWPSRPGEAQHDWEPPRVTLDKQTNRIARLKALGNAIVPQCVEYVAHCIVEFEQQRSGIAQ